MNTRTRSGAALAAAVALAMAAAGCCLPRSATSLDLNRDTPRNAQKYVVAALRDGRTGDLYDALHPAFAREQGVTAMKLDIAHSLRPGLFADVANLLEAARIESVVRDPRPFLVDGRPRERARVSMATSEGREGVFILVNRPSFVLVTDDGEVSPTGGEVDIAATVRIEGGVLKVEDLPLGPYAPMDGSTVYRLEIRNDWLLYGIESLDGLDALLDEAQSMNDETSSEAAPGQ